MHFSIAHLAGLAAVLTTASAHPGIHDHAKTLREASHKNTLHARSCSAEQMHRRESNLKRRREARHAKRDENGVSIAKRNIFNTIQNTTCVLAPETVWGPYGIDGELKRHDVREDQEGVNLYLDIGVMDVETCEPLPDAWLTIWNCNATGSYAGFTGINPNTASVLDGETERSDGTTDDRTFLRGITKTDRDGMTEFLTIFPGYYVSRTTHIHVTVQTNVTGHNTSYSDASVQHLGQLFFKEDLLNQVYQLAPYKAHLSTLNRTTNAADSLYSTASSGGYSSVVDVQLLGETISDGLVGYITIGVNRTAEAALTTGGSVNPIGAIPTVSVSAGAQAAAASKDASEHYNIADESK